MTRPHLTGADFKAQKPLAGVIEIVLGRSGEQRIEARLPCARSPAGGCPMAPFWTGIAIGSVVGLVILAACLAVSALIIVAASLIAIARGFIAGIRKQVNAASPTRPASGAREA